MNNRTGAAMFANRLFKNLKHLRRWAAREDIHCYRLYDADLVRQLGIESDAGFAVALELTAKAFARGVPIAETPTTWRDRSAGQSNFRLFRWLPSYLKWYRHALWAGWKKRRSNEETPMTSRQ